jgi:hypothetical protein
MIIDELERLFRSNFPFQLTSEQEIALRELLSFLFARGNEEAFLLRGFAGTGKTSLVSALVRTLDAIGQPTVLMAPTGRAAKVFSLYAEHAAFTIHKRIYRQKSFASGDGAFSLNFNPCKHTLFMVDEASMIANEGLSGTTFGTGRLLDDLIQFVYSGDHCRLLLMGDTAQLPPVGEEESPALSAEVLDGYGLTVHQASLTQVVRQGSKSGVLWNATRLRRIISSGDASSLPLIRLKGFADLCVLPGNELVEALEDCYRQVGMDQTVVVTRSNKRANIYNGGIRNQLLFREEELEPGDRLMVAKNSYFWAEKDAAQNAQNETAADRDSKQPTPHLDFIANGDIAVVRRLRHQHELYGLHFAEATLCFPDFDDYELDATVVLDSLLSEAPALTKEQAEQLTHDVLADYADLPLKRERMEKLKADPHYNALQIKYAYAITCHKAQGGQWQRVFLDQGYMTDDMLSPDYFRWLYTAFTRTTEKLYLVNWPEEQIEK